MSKLEMAIFRDAINKFTSPESENGRLQKSSWERPETPEFLPRTPWDPQGPSKAPQGAPEGDLRTSQTHQTCQFRLAEAKIAKVDLARASFAEAPSAKVNCSKATYAKTRFAEADFAKAKLA